MPDKAFLDTNILVYLHSEDDKEKREVAQKVLNDFDCITSIQALNEISNVWFKKLAWDGVKIEKHLNNIEQVCDEILTVDRATVNKALALKDRYGFAFFDCLMISSALDGKCQVLFSEDMSDGQVINKTLKIINPFK